MTINAVDTTALTLTALQQTELTQSIGATTGTTSAVGTGAVAPPGVPGGDSARISGPAHLFSQLQQLDAQDPSKFKQVVGAIAAQLQAAAQQATGHQADFLTSLADRFQTAATTGDVLSLRPHHGHHRHHAHATYNAQGQVVPPPPPSDTGGTSSTSGTGTDLGQLFANIENTVAAALGA